MDLLAAYGWNSDFAQHLGEDGCVPARVISQQRGRYWAVSASGELPVELSGRLRFQAAVPRQLPAVGDWLAVRLSADRGMVIRILPRKSVIARPASTFASSKPMALFSSSTVTTAPLSSFVEKRR